MREVYKHMIYPSGGLPLHADWRETSAHAGADRMFPTR